MNVKVRHVFMETAQTMLIPTRVIVIRATQGRSARLVRVFVFILKLLYYIIVILNKISRLIFRSR